MGLIQFLLITLAVSLVLMFLLWLLSVAKQNASIVDPYWGFGFVVLVWFAAIVASHLNGRSILIVTLVSIWGIRLSAYLLWRNFGKGEDRRYQAMRQKHGQQFWWVSLFTVFLLQGTIMWFVAMPLLVGLYHSPSASSLGIVDVIGIVVWFTGLFFETVGDYQMARFKSDPDNQGQVMDKGLWRYTRHPNYFGDFCVWWGHYLVSLAAGGWWTILSPALMSFFLIKVSGVELLESDMAERRPGYREYQHSTNAFFPGPPKTR